MIAGSRVSAFKDDLHHPVEASAMHIHQELHQLLARGLLRPLGHLVKLRDQLSEFSNLFLKFAAVRHTPPCECESECEPGRNDRPAHGSYE